MCAKVVLEVRFFAIEHDDDDDDVQCSLYSWRGGQVVRSNAVVRRRGLSSSTVLAKRKFNDGRVFGERKKRRRAVGFTRIHFRVCRRAKEMVT
jgi:hypothetical protein